MEQPLILHLGRKQQVSHFNCVQDSSRVTLKLLLTTHILYKQLRFLQLVLEPLNLQFFLKRSVQNGPNYRVTLRYENKMPTDANW